MWSAADIVAWEPEIKPLSLNKTPTLREAVVYFRRYMLGANIVCPLGGKVALSVGHFFPLVCCAVPGGKTKGFVKAAKNLPHALELIEQGIIDVRDVPGCDYQRVNDLPLFSDVICSPHLIGAKCGKKRIYVKRYEAKKPRIKVAVIYPKEDGLRPASFHTTDLDVAWLDQNCPEILWQKNRG